MSEPLREIFALFDIKVDDKQIADASKNVDGFLDKLKAAGKIVAEVFAVEKLKEFVQNQVEAATELERTASRLGLTTSQVQLFNLAAGEAGVRADAMSTGLRFLNRSIAEAAKGGGEQAQAFHKLGISLKDADGKSRDVGAVMTDLADKLSLIPEASTKTEIAMKLLGRGGSELLPILNKGGEAFRQAARDMEELGGARSQGVIDGAKRILEQETRLTFGLNNLKATLAAELFPIFEKLLKIGVDVVKWIIDVTKNTYIFKTALEVLGGVAAYKALISLNALVKTFGLLKPTILENAIALGEFALPLIVIGLLYLAFDDLYTLMNGGESVIGDLLDSFLGLGSAAALANALNSAWAVTVDLFEGLAEVIAGVVMPIFVSLWEILKGIALALWGIANFDPSAALSALKGIGSGIGDAVLAGAQTFGGGLGQIVGQGPDAHALATGGGAPQGRTREPTAFGFPEAKGHTREPIAVTFGPGAPGGHHVVQHLTLTQHIQTKQDDAKTVGDAAGQGAATAAERATSNALQANRKT